MNKKFSMVLLGLTVVIALAFLCGCGKTGTQKQDAKPVKAPTISVKSEKIVDDYIRDISTADKNYKNINIAVTGKVRRKGQYSDSQTFYILTIEKVVGDKNYSVQLNYPVSKVDDVNKLNIGDFVAAEGKCVGMVPQDDPTAVSVQIHVGEIAYTTKGDATQPQKSAKESTPETAPAATPAPAAPPAPSKPATSNVITLSAEQQQNMDVFFSNFAEAWGNPPQGGRVSFEYNKITNKDLILFGVFHTFINRQQVVQKINGQYVIPVGEINYVTNKYFGKTVVPEAINNLVTTDGDNFYSRENDGPAFWGAAKLKQMYDNGNGTFSADVYVYTSPDSTNDYSHGKLWKAILAVSPSDSSRYILKSWKKGW